MSSRIWRDQFAWYRVWPPPAAWVMGIGTPACGCPSGPISYAAYGAPIWGIQAPPTMTSHMACPTRATSQCSLSRIAGTIAFGSVLTISMSVRFEWALFVENDPMNKPAIFTNHDDYEWVLKRRYMTSAGALLKSTHLCKFDQVWYHDQYIGLWKLFRFPHDYACPVSATTVEILSMMPRFPSSLTLMSTSATTKEEECGSFDPTIEWLDELSKKAMKSLVDNGIPVVDFRVRHRFLAYNWPLIFPSNLRRRLRTPICPPHFDAPRWSTPALHLFRIMPTYLFSIFSRTAATGALINVLTLPFMMLESLEMKSARKSVLKGLLETVVAQLTYTLWIQAGCVRFASGITTSSSRLFPLSITTGELPYRTSNDWSQGAGAYL